MEAILGNLKTAYDMGQILDIGGGQFDPEEYIELIEFLENGGR